ncbi:YunG family protein [Streptomyces hebeiensis]
MTPWNLLDLDRALRESWALDTCSPDDLDDWRPGNPARGHCDITALIVQDVFGGSLVVGEVYLDGTQHGFHWWNRLPSGVELDLTREQFLLGQTIGAARVVERPAGPLPRRWDEYLLLRERVGERLGSGLPEGKWRQPSSTTGPTLPSDPPSGGRTPTRTGALLPRE